MGLLNALLSQLYLKIIKRITYFLKNYIVHLLKFISDM